MVSEIKSSLKKNQQHKSKSIRNTSHIRNQKSTLNTSNASQKRQTNSHLLKKAKPKVKVSIADTRIIAFNKPFDVLTQFTDDANRKTLKDYINIEQVYPAGRLDKDSEGLLILTNNGQLQHQLANPAKKQGKTYWVQVEGQVQPEHIKQLEQGVVLKDGLTKPAIVQLMPEPSSLWPRIPPIRSRQSIPTAWLKMTIFEGKNRQVRRMTAHVGLPTLRLIRVQIANVQLESLQPGEWREVDYHTLNLS